jgi:hypothetical protein
MGDFNPYMKMPQAQVLYQVAIKEVFLSCPSERSGAE